MILLLIGGIGSGKSAVMSFLTEECHFQGLRTDDLAKSFYRNGNPVFSALRGLMGEDIVAEGGATLRLPLIRERIYRDPGLRAAVEEIVHPAVWEEVERQIRACRSEGRNLAVETALPVKKYADAADACCFVYADRETRLSRLEESRGMGRKDAEAVLSVQPPDSFYRELATFEVDNSRSLKEATDEVYKYCKRFQR